MTWAFMYTWERVCILNIEGQGGLMRETTLECKSEGALRHPDVWGRAFLAEETIQRHSSSTEPAAF